MQITVKLGGRLRDYLPAGGGNSVVRTMPESTPLAELLGQLGIREDTDTLLVIVDQQNIPPSERADYRLRNGQLVNVMPPLTGG